VLVIVILLVLGISPTASAAHPAQLGSCASGTGRQEMRPYVMKAHFGGQCGHSVGNGPRRIAWSLSWPQSHVSTWTVASPSVVMWTLR
jgi:hypothetical protein